MKAKLLIATLSALIALSASAEPPVVVEGSAIDKSVDPASVTYTARDKNMYGQPMEIVVPKQFESDAGLIAVARRIAADNAKYQQVGMPVQIYSADDAHRELAEYWHHAAVHDLRITGPDGLVRKIIKLPKAESSGSAKTQPGHDDAATGASIALSAVTYKVAEGGTTRLFDIIIPQKFATEPGLIAVAKRLDKDTANLPVVAVEIYDNAKAEFLVTSGKIDDSNEKFCQQHELASYERNLNANINRLRLYETITKGNKKEVSFTTGEPTGGIFSHQ